MILKNTFALALFSSLTLAANAQTIDWRGTANPSLHGINSVAFSSDGQSVISGTNCHPAYIRVFDVADGTITWDYSVGNSLMCIMGVTFSSNSNYIAAIEEFGNLLIFDNSGASPVILDTIITNTSYAFATAISPDNSQVAVACSNGKLKIYSLADGSLLHDITAHTSWTSTVAYSPDGNYIATGGNDDKVKVWHTDGSLLFAGISHTADITSVKFSPDNNYVISAAKDDKVKIWDVSSTSLLRSIDAHNQDVSCIDISPDGSKIVSVSYDGTGNIWNFADGSLLTSLTTTNAAALQAVAWAPSGDKIATGNSQSDLTLWSIPNTLSTNLSIVPQLFISPNPAQNYISINIEAQQIDIYDAQGRLQRTAKQTSIVDISDLPAGLYFLSAQNAEARSTSKFTIYR